MILKQTLVPRCEQNKQKHKILLTKGCVNDKTGVLISKHSFNISTIT